MIDRIESIDVVDYRDFVTTLDEPARKTLYPDCVATKAVGWIERCWKAELQSAHAALRIAFITALALASHVSAFARVNAVAEQAV